MNYFAFLLSNNKTIDHILDKNVILELDALTQSDKTFFIESALFYLHHKRMTEERREDFKHAIIIEESHHILSDERRSLVGFNRGRIATSYSTGTVSGDKRVGGLMGRKSKKKLLFDVFAILRWRFLREFADSARILLIMR